MTTVRRSIPQKPTSLTVEQRVTKAAREAEAAAVMASDALQEIGEASEEIGDLAERVTALEAPEP